MLKYDMKRLQSSKASLSPESGENGDLNERGRCGPAGYVLDEKHSPLTLPWAPIYIRNEPQRICLAVRVGEAHCNARGFAHGGLLTALADLAMGRSALAEADRRGFPIRSGVTTSLAIDFLESAARGDLVEWIPEVLRTGKALSVVECRVRCGDRLVARANATFRMINRE